MQPLKLLRILFMTLTVTKLWINLFDSYFELTPFVDNFSERRDIKTNIWRPRKYLYASCVWRSLPTSLPPSPCTPLVPTTFLLWTNLIGLARVSSSNDIHRTNCSSKRASRWRLRYLSFLNVPQEPVSFSFPLFRHHPLLHLFFFFLTSPPWYDDRKFETTRSEQR